MLEYLKGYRVSNSVAHSNSSFTCF